MSLKSISIFLLATQVNATTADAASLVEHTRHACMSIMAQASDDPYAYVHGLLKARRTWMSQSLFQAKLLEGYERIGAKAEQGQAYDYVELGYYGLYLRTFTGNPIPWRVKLALNRFQQFEMAN